MSTATLPTFETIRLALAGPVATLTLNRPERLNAAPPQMFDEIRVALALLPEAGARALVITGEGRAFCSGADLQGAATRPEGASRGEGSLKALTEHYNPTMRALAELPIPVITAVNGPAAGIGASLALAGDFAIAGQSAYFLEAFVNIGLVPDGGATWMLPRLVGKARAMQMMVLGERIGAAQAAEWGLIYQAVADADLQATAQALAERLANGPTRAYALIRQGVLRSLEQNYADTLAMEARHQLQAAGTADAAEGGKAFLERRKAQFQGR